MANQFLPRSINNKTKPTIESLVDQIENLTSELATLKMAFPYPPTGSGLWRTLTAFPFAANVGTNTITKDIWQGGLLVTNIPILLSEVGIWLSVLASGGTASGRIALYSQNPDGSPGDIVKDLYDDFGDIDLTGGIIGRRTLITSGLIIDPGRYILSFGWTGTATIKPQVGSINGGTWGTQLNSQPVLTGASGYGMTANVDVAPSIFINDTSGTPIIIYGRNT